MIRSLYTSGWTMLANERKMDVISNNMSNANTTAFKKDTVVFETFPDMLTSRINDTKSRINPRRDVGSMKLGSDVSEISTNFNLGQIVKTGNNLDLSITNSPNAFFTVQGPNNQTLYTKDGSFSLDQNGQLISKDGYLILGENGPITLNGEEFRVAKNGDVIQNGEIINKINIAQFENTESLRKNGNNLYTTIGEFNLVDFNGQIEQGSLEQSNVNIIREMVDMITVIRSYEANQKMIQSIDLTLQKAVNDIGPTR